jgi:acetoin utilization deacetylase AcuC-like enzyme
VTIWDERYCTDAAPTNSTRKQREVVGLAQRAGLLSTREAPFDAEATWPEVARVHDPAYVEAVRTGAPRQLAESQGFRWSPAFADAVARTWSGHASACRLALKEGIVFHPVSGAHHASATRGGGFCTFNFLAGAARTMLREGLDSVAVIDLDAHPGDGTYRLDGTNPGVALFDIAGSVWIDVANDGRVEYHVARHATDYREALERLPAFLDRTAPRLVQYQAGMDPLEEDPIGGIPGVDEAFLRWRDEFVVAAVRGRGIPLVVNLAGGYLEGVSARLHFNTVCVLAEAADQKP